MPQVNHCSILAIASRVSETSASTDGWTYKILVKEWSQRSPGVAKFQCYLRNAGSEKSLGESEPVTMTKFLKSPLPDKTPEKTYDELVQKLVSKITQFKHKVEFNSWVKEKPHTFAEKLAKLQSY